MVDIREIGDLECRRNRAGLVDFAEGMLDEADTLRIEEHLRRCPNCAAALSALREIPSLLREGGEMHDEAFWARQRSDIMERICRDRRIHTGRRGLVWRTGLAAAAALVLAVIGYGTIPRHELETPDAAPSVAQLDDEAVAELTDLVELYVPERSFLRMDVVFEGERVPAPLANAGEESGNEELRQFSQEELEGLQHLLGELG